MYKLHEWADIDKLKWDCLFLNPNAIELTIQ
jgi:hypothetical protein